MHARSGPMQWDVNLASSLHRQELQMPKALLAHGNCCPWLCRALKSRHHLLGLKREKKVSIVLAPPAKLGNITYTCRLSSTTGKELACNSRFTQSQVKHNTTAHCGSSPAHTPLRHASRKELVFATLDPPKGSAVIHRLQKEECASHAVAQVPPACWKRPHSILAEAGCLATLIILAGSTCRFITGIM